MCSSAACAAGLKNQFLARDWQAGPPSDFTHQGIHQIGAIDARQIVRRRKSAQCQRIGHETIARAKSVHRLRIDRRDLSRNNGRNLVAQIDNVEAGKSLDARALFSANQKARIARHYNVDTLQHRRDIDGPGELSDCPITGQRDEDRPQTVACSHATLSHFFRMADELRAASLHPTNLHDRFVVVAVAHLLHSPRSRLSRSRKTSWETAVTSTASRTARGVNSVMC